MPDQNSPGSQPAAPRVPPIVTRLPGQQIRRIGLRIPWRSDLYHRTLTLRWWEFLGVGCAIYLGINLVFAELYLRQPGAIAGAKPGDFLDAFFFSVQTIATIGYGQMSPATVYANTLVTIETMAGLIFLALATGVVFARISRPTARVMFARVATIAPHNGVPTLSLRIGNERRSQILEAFATVSLLRYERTLEGVEFRRFYDLPLARTRTPVFTLTYTVMHTIDEASPLYGVTHEALVAEEAQLLVTVSGIEETTSQTVHARYSYMPEEIVWGHRYADIFSSDPDGTRVIDYARFHETGPA